MSYNNYQPPALVYVIAFLLAIHAYTFPFIITHDSGILFGGGPFAFLATRVQAGLSRIWLFLFDMLVVVNFFFLFKDFLKKCTNKFIGVFILLGVMLAMNTMHGADLGWLVLVFILYWMNKTYLEPSNASFIMLAILAIVGLYIKADTGCLGVLLLVLHAGLLTFINKINVRHSIIFLAGLLVSILASAWLLDVNIPSYASNAFNIINGNSISTSSLAPALEVKNNIELTYELFKFLFISFGVYLFFRGKIVQMVFLLLNFGYIFLLREQTLLNNSPASLTSFFGYAPLILVYGSLVNYRDTTQKYFSAYILFIVILCLCFKIKMTEHVDDIFDKRFKTKTEYLKQVIAD